MLKKVSDTEHRRRTNHELLQEIEVDIVRKIKQQQANGWATYGELVQAQYYMRYWNRTWAEEGGQEVHGYKKWSKI